MITITLHRKDFMVWSDGRSFFDYILGSMDISEEEWGTITDIELNVDSFMIPDMTKHIASSKSIRTK